MHIIYDWPQSTAMTSAYTSAYKYIICHDAFRD